MSAIASQITSLTIVYSIVYSDADQRKQSSASLAFVSPVNSPHKWPVKRKMFPFDDVIMKGLSTSRALPKLIWLALVILNLFRKHRNALEWPHNGPDGVSNHHSRLFRRRSKKIPKLRVTGLCEGNPPVTGGFPSQRASKAENVSIWWRHRDICSFLNHSWMNGIVTDDLATQARTFFVRRYFGGDMWPWTDRSTLVHVMVWRSTDNQNQCCLIVNWNLMNKLHWTFYLKIHFHSWKFIWKCRLQNGNHVVISLGLLTKAISFRNRDELFVFGLCKH